MPIFTAEHKAEHWQTSPGQTMLYVVCSMVLWDRLAGRNPVRLLLNHNWYWNLHPFIVGDTGLLFGCKVRVSRQLNAVPVVIEYD